MAPSTMLYGKTKLVQSGNERIEKITHKHGAVAEAYRLECAYLPPLFLDKPRHCGERDEGGDEKENYGQQFAEAGYSVGVATIVDAGYNCASVEHVPLGLGHEGGKLVGRYGESRKLCEKFFVAAGALLLRDAVYRLLCRRYHAVVLLFETVKSLCAVDEDIYLSVVAKLKRLRGEQHKAVYIAVAYRAAAAVEVHILGKVAKTRNGIFGESEFAREIPSVARGESYGIAHGVSADIFKKGIDETFAFALGIFPFGNFGEVGVLGEGHELYDASVLPARHYVEGIYAFGSSDPFEGRKRGEVVAGQPGGAHYAYVVQVARVVVALGRQEHIGLA